MKKNILITGSSGMLGKDVMEVMLKSDFNVIGISREDGDLTDSNFVKDILNKNKPDVIINCAALVNVEACEKNRDSAYKLHVELTKNLANYKKTKLIYISTDSVFDGQRGNYKEDDKTNPQNYYALSKLEGEKEALKNANSIVIRTNIYGYNSALGKSFVEWAIDNLKNNKPINGFADVYFNPLYTKQLARIIKYFVENNYRGIINAAADKSISKYEFLKKLAQKLDFDDNLISPSSIDKQKFSAKRPKNSSLNTEKLSKIYSDKNDLSLDFGLEELSRDYKIELEKK